MPGAVEVSGLGPLNATQTSAATTLQTLSLVPGSNRARVKIKAIALYSSAATQSVTLVVQDNGVTKLDLGTVATPTTPVGGVTLFQLGAEGFIGTAGSTCQVVVGAAASGTTTVSAVAEIVL